VTVIAYKAGVMACDSLWTEGGVAAVSRTKMHRTKFGLLVGCAGQNDSRSLKDLLERCRKPADLPTTKQLHELQSDIHALVVFPTKQVFSIWIEPGDEGERGVTEISLPFYAIGCGSDVALGAMASGATAKEAAGYACDFDINCRRPIHALVLRTK
jgi:hypothetical protein